jgi:hypothetical protein
MAYETPLNNSRGDEGYIREQICPSVNSARICVEYESD